MTWRSNRRAAGGFTLLETVIVVIVLGLMLTILAGFVPHRPDRLELANAANMVAGTLRLARARAIASGRPVMVQLVGGQLVAGQAATAPGGGPVTAVDSVPRTLPGAVTLAMAGPPVLRFTPDGSASGGAVRVAGPVQAMLVTVEWLTGRVSIADAK